MQDSWIAQVQNIGVWCVYLSIAVIAVWESVSPRRPLSYSLRQRWLHNIALFILNTVLLRLFGPTLTVVLAFEFQEAGLGLFNVVDAPGWLALVGSFLFLDFCFYLKHRLAHAVPWLWRIHRAHHSDGDIDVTTSLRFHPLDVAYQIALQVLAVLVIGATPLAVALYIVVFMVVSRLQHGNVHLPAGVDSALRLFIVTGDMHRIHHSAHQPETDSNYGGVFPWHDRLLSTYVSEPRGGHQRMHVGLHEFSDPKHMTLGWMLLNPLLSADKVTVEPGEHPASAGPARIEFGVTTQAHQSVEGRPECIGGDDGRE